MALQKTTQAPQLVRQPDIDRAAIDAATRAVEDRMREVLHSEVDVLTDASHHILEAGGKRVRPRMTLLCYAAAGGEDLSEPVSVAAAVELMHTASVVHDDINDHGVMRRGRPSVNAIWGRTFALLTGDYLFTKVYELMAPYGDLNVELAEAAVALVEGETLQASAVKNNTFTREIYYRIIALKTAALFKSAAKLGALMADADKKTVAALEQYGFNVGLAFQIIDDVLDMIGDDTQLGKTSGIDVEQGRGFAVAHDGNGANKETADPMEKIKAKILSGNAIEEARERARQLADIAIDGLSVLPDTEARDELVALANMVVERDR